MASKFREVVSMKKVTHALGRAFRESGQALNALGFLAADDMSFRDHYSRHRTVMPLYDKQPTASEGAFIAPCASVVGSVAVGAKASVWYGAVVRGDAKCVAIGAGTNVQDHAVIKTTEKSGTSIGSHVTIGHNAVLTGCTVGDTSLIGMGAVVGEGAMVEGGSLVAAGAVVAPGTVVKSGELWGGNPAVKMRDLKTEEKTQLSYQASEYVKLAAEHMK